MTSTPSPHQINTDTLTGQLTPIRKVVLAMGSNIGDREGNLAGAVMSLGDTPDLHIRGVSRVYESPAVDSVVDAPDFYNAVMVADSMLTPQMLNERCHAIEAAYGRERPFPNAPRTLDIDLIVVGETVMDSEDLTLPHPRAQERAFVIVPWAEIDPHASIPGVGRLTEILGHLDTSGLRVVTGLDLQA
jgi:2-amino-4-hydroxy-6-hydroxymethyldihydropteridine diphosphokinase